ncbi:NADPH-dependent FMN reductase [Marinimicrobium sp. ARAG 43.8]|uniref:NADPH-dependent FMN reductase n=1 Tax=Marinimicrobium sp. ARAG 43.8 TaxID=3418719 RepID=UPI003CEDEDAE
MSVTLLALAGSARQDSLNKRLVRAAADSAERAGAHVTFVDLNDYPLPIYHGDLEAEQGVPEASRPLRKLLREHDGLLIASPEYNGFVTPLLVNTLDWLSRKDGDESGLALFGGKYGVLMSASPGPMGGIRSLASARQFLGNLGVTLLPGQLAVPQAHQAFDERGALKDEGLQARLDSLTQTLVKTLSALKP